LILSSVAYEVEPDARSGTYFKAISVNIITHTHLLVFPAVWISSELTVQSFFDQIHRVFSCSSHCRKKEEDDGKDDNLSVLHGLEFDCPEEQISDRGKTNVLER
jgi:hypothetical protein